MAVGNVDNARAKIFVLMVYSVYYHCIFIIRMLRVAYLSADYFKIPKHKQITLIANVKLNFLRFMLNK